MLPNQVCKIKIPEQQPLTYFPSYPKLLSANVQSKYLKSHIEMLHVFFMSVNFGGVGDACLCKGYVRITCVALQT